MNTLSKIKSDARVVEVKKAVESGKVIEVAEARVASGNGKHDPIQT